MRFCIGRALRPLILVAMLGGHTVAAFKSSSSNVGTGSDRSSLLNYLNDANGESDDDSSVALNDIAGDATLQLVADFVNSVGVHQVDLAVEWAMDRLGTAGLPARCRLLTAAHYLGMRLLMLAIASISDWDSRTAKAMGRVLPREVLVFAGGVVRLRLVAHSYHRQRIAREIHGLLLGAGNTSTVVNTAEWCHELRLNILQWAAVHGEALLVEFLLIYVPGVDVNARDGFGLTSLHLAVSGSRSRTVSVQEFDSRRSWHYETQGPSAGSRHETTSLQPVNSVALPLFAPGVDVSARRRPRATDHDEPAGDDMGELLRKDADRNMVNRRAHVVELLVNAGEIDVNAGDTYGDTPLHLASCCGYDSGRIIAALLGARDINANARDARGRTPLHCLAMRPDSEPEVAQALLKARGIDVNARDAMGRTPLHYAARYGHYPVVQLLLDAAGTTVAALDTRRQTPLQVAESRGMHDVARLLRRAARRSTGIARRRQPYRNT
ncbi:unnamed protein product (mitochondrion) [Plasmodiophora brassicae]|uniref:Uncharacterized protein n=1 Tax=Plasmodiophora brassicae TaxID=37360 RepID=A0A0G4ITV5_PLABS|nr:hypothetical protein PBRA_006751 [Plasmodiophora brassicae]SPR00774.1 unnamed protein product [Plasmodiophora brassicae]